MKPARIVPNRRVWRPGFLLPLLLLAELSALNGQNAKTVIDRAVASSASGEKNLRAVIQDVEQAASSAQGADKRALYSFLGDLKEKAGNYAGASRDYATAAGIPAGSIPGMPRVSAEQLVINAVRCALSAGDYVTAEAYLASQVKDSTDPAIAAYVRLYTVWSRLSRMESPEALDESLSILRSYSTNSAMEAVRPAVLLSIWYIDGDAKSAGMLIAQYPNSPEAAIVQGEASFLPAPFWYFSPRKNADTGFSKTAPPAPAQDANTAPPVSIPGTGAAAKLPVRQQVGLFRNEDYANVLVKRLSQQGFNGVIRQETRNGVVYHVVFVPENSSGTVGARLRAAGFECYPIYE